MPNEVLVTKTNKKFYMHILVNLQKISIRMFKTIYNIITGEENENQLFVQR